MFKWASLLRQILKLKTISKVINKIPGKISLFISKKMTVSSMKKFILLFCSYSSPIINLPKWLKINTSELPSQKVRFQPNLRNLWDRQKYLWRMFQVKFLSYSGLLVGKIWNRRLYRWWFQNEFSVLVLWCFRHSLHRCKFYKEFKRSCERRDDEQTISYRFW